MTGSEITAPLAAPTPPPPAPSPLPRPYGIKASLLVVIQRPVEGFKSRSYDPDGLQHGFYPFFHGIQALCRFCGEIRSTSCGNCFRGLRRRGPQLIQSGALRSVGCTARSICSNRHSANPAARGLHMNPNPPGPIIPGPIIIPGPQPLPSENGPGGPG